MSLERNNSLKNSATLPKVLLHVGRHKSGTSAIQAFLALNDELLAEEYGVLYPQIGRDPKGNYHHPLFRPLVENMVPLDQAKLHKIQQEAQDRNCHTILLSSEMLSRIKLSEDHLKGVRDAFQGHEIRVILYFRQQDSFLRSTYAHRIKIGFVAAPTKIQDLDPAMDYFEFANRYASIFGKHALTIRSYDEDTAKGLFESFLSIMDIPLSDAFSRPTSRVNQRLPWRYIELIRHANRWPWTRKLAMHRYVHRTAINLLRQFPDFMDSPEPLSPEQGHQIVISQQTSNNQLAREFLNRESLF
ncbi:hypothetical protein [Acaryochloris marina]|uniref:Sulfotransferase domain-containing protein n=1 Tax=Acaryochloris marina (strain MBIC 11017) TaxID=329726 RepID=B0CEH5_ACAM1|nr:hypothetical protein [Acaryochloris marina]ABW26941.1 hypothetical protein AM1_1923 [Acaryochloris marina MBIC11017]BDM81709.1 hypothetical protein AM10699_45760 [Acaryochloris marina MBIC10699]